MGLYPPLETIEDSYRLQHIAELKSRLKIAKDFRARLYKRYRRGVDAVVGIDVDLSVVGVGLAASGVSLLSTIVAAPVALGLQAAAAVCGLVGAGAEGF